MNKNTQHLRALHEAEQNKLRNPAFIKLKHSINSCLNWEQLQTLYSLIHSYWDKNEDGNDLYFEYQTKKNELCPVTFEDELLTMYHRNTCGFKP